MNGDYRIKILASDFASGFGFGLDLPAALIERRVRGNATRERPYTFGNECAYKSYSNELGYGRGPLFYIGFAMGCSNPLSWLIFGLYDVDGIKHAKYNKEAITASR